MLSKSTDGGQTFTKPVYASPAHTGYAGYAWGIPALAPDGTIYVNYIYFASCYLGEEKCYTLDTMLSKSTDGSATFGPPTKITTALWHSFRSPYTVFRTGIYEFFTINPVNGHLLVALQNATAQGYEKLIGQGGGIADNTDILLYESADGGQSWNTPIRVNDNTNSPADMFQPVVAVSPSGLVAVGFYDRRLTCPATVEVVPNDVGESNRCIDVTTQFYTDEGSLKPVGHNVRVTKTSWDPNTSGTSGLTTAGQKLTFIGDYFGLALTDSMAYPFFTANFNLGENPTNDVQIFVGRVKTPINVQTTSTTTPTSALVTTTNPTQSGITTSSHTEETGQPLVLGQNTLLVAIVVVVVAFSVAAIAFSRRQKAQTHTQIWDVETDQRTQTMTSAGFCVNCGAALRPDSQFCKECGARAV
jgi:hypothetical protein